VVFKNRPLRDRVYNVIINTGSLLFVICGKNIDGRGISNGPRLALYIPSALGGLEDLFTCVGMKKARKRAFLTPPNHIFE